MLKRLVLVAAMVMGVMGIARADGIDPILTRQAGLDLLAGTAANVKNLLAANGDVKALEASGKGIQKWATQMPTLFPAGSDKGATKASPDIWTDNAGFLKAAKALADAGGALADAAKSGDAAATATAFKAVGDACGACHKAYRLK